MSKRSPFSQDPVNVMIGSYSCAIPHRNAAEWINAISGAQGPNALVLALSRENLQGIIKDELAVGEISAQEITDASLDLLKEVLPYSWWKSARLLLLSSQPEVLGRTVLAGMDPWTLTVAQWCAGVYSLCTEHADDKGKFKFDASLENPPAGVEDDWADENFDAMVAQARRMPGMG